MTVPPCIDERGQVIDWLVRLQLPPLPVAPAKNPYKYPRVVSDKGDRGIWQHCPLTKDLKPNPAYTGKNPSYLDAAGEPHLVRHQDYQNRLPTKVECQTWFANPVNGIGTLGGWQDLVWLDFDRKQFDSQDECNQAFYSILTAHPELTESWSEQTQGGGYRLAVRCAQKPQFKNFALEPSGRHRGEAQSTGSFSVLAPTIGVSGKLYVNMRRAEPVKIESLELIGIYPSSTRQSAHPTPRGRSDRPPSPVLGSLALEELGNPKSRAILNGEDATGDRSAALTTAIREWHGWQQWALSNNISVSGSPEDLAHYAGQALGIDSDRVERILKTISPTDCHPAALYKGEQEACWLKIRRLDRVTFDEKCPELLKGTIIQKQRKQNERQPGGESDSSKVVAENNASELKQNNRWSCPASYNHELGVWKNMKMFEDESEIPEQMLSAGFRAVPSKVKVKTNEGTQIVDGYMVQAFEPKANFDFHVDRILESKDGGGLVLTVERLLAEQITKSRVIIPSIALNTVSDCLTALKKGLGCNISCLLKLDDLQRLINVRTNEYLLRGGRVYKLIDRIGHQEDGTWVFENIQFNSTGKLTTEEESGWVFNPSLGEVEKIPSPKIAPQNPAALKHLTAVCKEFFHPETLPLVLFNCGFATAVLHRQQIYQEEACFPQCSNFGDAGGGKTTAASVASSLVGMFNPIAKFSESVAYELAKSLSGIVLFFDDPIKKGMKREDRDKLDDYLWKLYNGAARKVRGNEQVPHTAVLVTTNPAVGEDNAAVESRLIKFYFAVKPTKGSLLTLRRAMKQASGGISQLISLGYSRDDIAALEDRISKQLRSSHARMSRNLAIVTHYTQKFCDLAEVEFDALQYCLDYLCPSADDAHSDVDSLSDFLEKLQSLKSQTLIGEWNVTTIERESGKYFAICMTEVWEEFARKFSVNYSKQSITSLAKEHGGEANRPAKFVGSKLEWIEYLKSAAAHQRGEGGNNPPTKPPKIDTRKALLIPYDLVRQIWEAGQSDEAIASGSNSPSSDVTSSESNKPLSNPEEVTEESSKNQVFQTQVTAVTAVTAEKVTPTQEVDTESKREVNSRWMASVQMRTLAPGDRVRYSGNVDSDKQICGQKPLIVEEIKGSEAVVSHPDWTFGIPRRLLPLSDLVLIKAGDVA
ncbi:MAG: hypothetical protein KME15_25885 [Drouetiella hepatica Uher 2000/2452]|jgi:hypothetical protein|uniref:DNA primase/polymerase bifunctional N-terminal domain-containing protein n=1 Tax=Drouetiella hepatica Uher 2000/2452 TaxID=904376 RepID=A0A951QHW8_9CYAN|nr:hypothetical protein [Drouetiella hepatica Uher 2000/2452]